MDRRGRWSAMAAADAVVTALVLIGPVVVLALALMPIVRLRFGCGEGAVRASISIRLAWGHIAIALMALGVLGVLFSHILAETRRAGSGQTRACRS